MPIDRSRKGGLARIAAALTWWAVLGTVPARAQFGLVASGAGPINRSMAGAATGAPLDAAGALYWNPATISALDQSEMVFGTEIVIPRTTITSHISAGSLGPGSPGLTGHNGANNGVFPPYVFALVHKLEGSPWTLGVAVFTLGGFAVNYPSSRTNPILTPQPPFGLGVGALNSQYLAYQFAPTVGYQLSDTVSVGFAPNLDLGTLTASPAGFALPTLVPTPLGPAPVFPAATGGRYRWGGGFQVGVYYNPGNDWRFGAALKSPQWFETYTYNSVSVNGVPVTPKFNLDYPMIASVGGSYTGFDRTLIATDFRFIDYRDTNGFRHSGFSSQGELTGLGWQNVFAVATGVQYRCSDALSVRGGYSFSLNPVGNAVTSFNIASPQIIQHTLTLGASYNVTSNLKFSLAYLHFFQNETMGPIVEPFVGPIHASSVRTTATGDSVVLGATVMY